MTVGHSPPRLDTGRHQGRAEMAGGNVAVNSVSATGPFTIGTPSTPLPHAFAQGSTFTVPVTFTPTTTGSANGLLHFVAGVANDQYDFSLHGTGTRDGLSVDPSAVASVR